MRSAWPATINRPRLATVDERPLIAGSIPADDARVEHDPAIQGHARPTDQPAGVKETVRGHTGRDAADPGERRDADRLKTVGVSCNRGRVVDLSTRGMRLRTWRRWKSGQRRLVTLFDETARVTLEAKCVWVRPTGAFTRVVGLCFEHAVPEQERALAQLAETHNGAVGMIRMVGKTISPRQAA